MDKKTEFNLESEQKIIKDNEYPISKENIEMLLKKKNEAGLKINADFQKEQKENINHNEKQEKNKKINLFNYQKIQSQNFFIFNVKYEKKEEFQIYWNNHIILLLKNKDYFLLDSEEIIKNIEVNFTKDFVSLILYSNAEKEFIYKENKIKEDFLFFIEKNDFKIFDREKRENS